METLELINSHGATLVHPHATPTTFLWPLRCTLEFTLPRCTFDYNSYRISSPELQDLFLVELVTLLFETLFSFLIPNSQHTHRR